MKADSYWSVTNYSLSHDALDGLQSENKVIRRGSAPSHALVQSKKRDINVRHKKSFTIIKQGATYGTTCLYLWDTSQILISHYSLELSSLNSPVKQVLITKQFAAPPCQFWFEFQILRWVYMLQLDFCHCWAVVMLLCKHGVVLLSPNSCHLHLNTAEPSH